MEPLSESLGQRPRAHSGNEYAAARWRQTVLAWHFQTDVSYLQDLLGISLHEELKIAWPIWLAGTQKLDSRLYWHGYEKQALAQSFGRNTKMYNSGREQFGNILANLHMHSACDLAPHAVYPEDISLTIWVYVFTKVFDCSIIAHARNYLKTLKTQNIGLIKHNEWNKTTVKSDREKSLQTD